MRKLYLLILVALCASGVALAQLPGPNQTTDILGAHNVGGRGCISCHVPHSGGKGNNIATTDPNNGMYALWGPDLSPLYGLTFYFSGDGGTKYAVTLPSASSTPAGGMLMDSANMHDANTQVLFCLSCHDGALTSPGMMTGVTVENLPVVGGKAPTWLAKAAPANGPAYSNDHPVGDFATVSCNSSSTGGQPFESGYNWDCIGGGKTGAAITASSGSNFAKYLVNNPSSFWNAGGNPLSPGLLNGATVNAITCSTCHDQHSMTAFQVNGTGYLTMFFIKGYYNPGPASNSTAQFCRNCHGGESNEMHGVYNVPTT